MASAFEFDDYREFIRERLSELPNGGYGQLSQIARHLGIHSTLVSQILKGHKELTVDQAIAMGEYFGLVDLELEFFVLLVQIVRAGVPSARRFYKNQLERVRDQANNLSRRVKADVKLREEQRAIFYSDWAYSAVRQTVAIPGKEDLDSIAAYVGLPRRKVKALLDFLVQVDLCKHVKGQYKVGPASTYVERGSPWVRVHHSNWRTRAIQALDADSQDHLHYTSPMTLSKTDIALVREKIIQFIEEVNQIVDPSPSEDLYCLNIDWFHGCARTT